MGLASTVFWQFLLAFVFLTAGIACTVVYSINSGTVCGINGMPPLLEWVLGTGIVSTVIGTMYVIAGIATLLHNLYRKFLPFLNMYAWGGFANIFALFSVPWTCVGINSCFCRGLDCATLNTPIWVVALVTILFFIAFVPFAITFHLAVNHLDTLKANELRKQEVPH